MDVVVTGIGLVSALGNLETSWQRLLAGESALQWQQPFPELPPKPLGMLHRHPYDFLSLSAAAMAAVLQDAGLSPPLPDCGVVIGSSRSQQGQWEQINSKLNSKIKNQHSTSLDSSWLDSLPHMGAMIAARQIGATGVVLAPMAACATGIWAIAQGFELIQTGQCQRAIVGAVETPITPLTLAGFEKMGALAKTGSYPFDLRREGLVLAEGAALLVLESAQFAQSRAARSYGKVLGFGLTADGHHVCATEPGGRTAIAAVKQCLDRSGISPNEIDYIHAHGTGTQLNDGSEAGLIQQIFPPGVSVSSTKGATGHTVGASGALGAAFCLMALKHQILPPCVGLTEPEFDLDLVTASRLAQIRRVLCFSFGFGGQNAVVAFGQDR